MYAIETKNITKHFGSIRANNDISFRVKKREIHALVGENGAGKSTLMSVIYGMYQADSGDIFIEGKKELISSPSKAIDLGIGMVHQHFMLIPTLSVTENIILGEEPTSKFQFLNLKRAEDKIRELSNRYSMEINPDAKIENLSVGQQQRVEILKILYRNADILILDEPTPVLTPQEIEDLFLTLKKLKSQGKTILIITHKLSEVMMISDSVSILRHGKFIGSLETKTTTKEELATLMVGREFEQITRMRNLPKTEKGLTVENLFALTDRNLPALRNISFSIAKGEIFAIAAIEGNGQYELVEVITCLRKRTAGRILIGSAELSKIIAHSKIAHIPEDRLKRGLILDFILSENFILGRQADKAFLRNGFFLRTAINSFADSLIQEFDIRPPDKYQTARSFSGGNQQKAIIARELTKYAEVVIASQPTRGLDIGATQFVHETLLKERDKGKAILLVTSDLEELLHLSDRVAVMYEGEIIIILDSKSTSELELGQYMTGARKKSA